MSRLSFAKSLLFWKARKKLVTGQIEESLSMIILRRTLHYRDFRTNLSKEIGSFTSLHFFVANYGSRYHSQWVRVQIFLL